MELTRPLRCLNVSSNKFDERPNVKIGVTNTVHSRLRDLKKKGDNFNDVIEKVLDRYQSDSIECDYKGELVQARRLYLTPETIDRLFEVPIDSDYAYEDRIRVLLDVYEKSLKSD